MKALFIANVELKETEGIFKKICAQSDAVGNAVGSCQLVTRRGNRAVLKEFLINSQVELDEGFFAYILKQIQSEEVGLIYIRHMIPCFDLVSVLRNAKMRGIKIFYEIPTYPYFGEQFKVSRKKYRAVAKIGVDLLFWPIIYHYINKLVVIRSNSKSHHFKKMVEINNGVKTDDIISKDYSVNNNTDKFAMVTVGTLYPYHGYDRVLKGLAKCGEKVDDKTVEFHVIGSSQTIDELHEMTKRLKLQHVFFHGTKSTEELNKMYEKFDLGLGCLALHRRNADIDTTLKIIEYYCRGVPVATSGISPMDKYEPMYTIHVEDSEELIDIVKLYNDYADIPLIRCEQISGIAKDKFSWDYIMGELMSE